MSYDNGLLFRSITELLLTAGLHQKLEIWHIQSCQKATADRVTRTTDNVQVIYNEYTIPLLRSAAFRIAHNVMPESGETFRLSGLFWQLSCQRLTVVVRDGQRLATTKLRALLGNWLLCIAHKQLVTTSRNRLYAASGSLSDRAIHWKPHLLYNYTNWPHISRYLRDDDCIMWIITKFSSSTSVRRAPLQ